MHFEPGDIYHVYNRGNDKIKIFFTDANYRFFLQKIKNEWLPFCDILAYCLMPNHFHFMLHPNKLGCEYIRQRGQDTHLQVLSKVIGKTLSSYTQAINLQKNSTGSLFQKKTKAKCLTEPFHLIPNYSQQDYLTNCFHYVHYNPKKARIVTDLKDWPYSSWPDYYCFRDGSLCNKELFMMRSGYTYNDFRPTHSVSIDDNIIKHIW